MAQKFNIGDKVMLNPNYSYSEDYIAALHLEGEVVAYSDVAVVWPYEVVFKGFDYKDWAYSPPSHCCNENELIAAK